MQLKRFSRFTPFSVILGLCLSGVFLSGCATGRPVPGRYSAQQLYDFACRPGASIESVQGTVWLKLQSSEMSGQFPANILVNSPDQLELEVTNFLGGTEAVISVTQDQYEITHLHGKSKKQKVGAKTWGGIPLKWATNLFLGRVPCPPLAPHSQLSVDTAGQLLVLIPEQGKVASQKFTYTFKEIENMPWPDSLHWEQLGIEKVSVDFEFDDFEKDTLSPKKWHAKSPQGSVKVRWRERSLFTSTKRP